MQIEEGEVALWCRGCIRAASGPSPLASCDWQAIVLEWLFIHLFNSFTSENLLGHLHSISETPP